MTEHPLLRLDAVGHAYDRQVALEAIDLVIHPGEVVGLVGPSGSGKSTLLSIAAGWEVPTAGSASWSPSLAPGWRGMAMIPQGLGLVAELTALENVELATDEDRAAAEALAVVGVDPDDLGRRRPDQLSLGQQQRIAVARALVGGPQLVLADEPTAHQDEEHADLVMGAFASLARSGHGGVLVSTHDRRLIAQVDRVVELIDGRLN